MQQMKQKYLITYKSAKELMPFTIHKNPLDIYDNKNCA